MEKVKSNTEKNVNNYIATSKGCRYVYNSALYRGRSHNTRNTIEVIPNLQEECFRIFAYCKEAGGWHSDHLI